MAKKSKIARNEQRKVIVERYAREAPRAEEGARQTRVAPTSSARPPVWACRSCPVTRRRCASAAATRSTAAPVVCSASSASRVCASATWPTVASCPA